MDLSLKRLMNNMLSCVPTLVQMMARDFTGNNTIAKLTPTITYAGNANKYFTIGSGQVTIKQTGYYKVTIGLRLSATSNAANVKRISLYKNGTEDYTVLSRLNTWEDVCTSCLARYNAGDVLTMWRRFEDGNSTASFGFILIEPVGGVLRNLSIFNAFGHFASLSKGGGVDEDESARAVSIHNVKHEATNKIRRVLLAGISRIQRRIVHSNLLAKYEQYERSESARWLQVHLLDSVNKRELGWLTLYSRPGKRGMCRLDSYGKSCELRSQNCWDRNVYTGGLSLISERRWAA